MSELLRTLWRRRMVIEGTVFILTILAVVIVFQLTPRYMAETMVMIDTRKSQVVDVEAVVSGLSADTEMIQSESLVIASRGLATRVIDRLDLWNDPEFNEELRPRSPFAELFDPKKYVPEEWLAALAGGSREEELSEDEKLERRRTRVIDTFLEELEVHAVGRSRVIRISIESESPRTAAQITNTLAELYIVAQLEAMFEATRRANTWLNERVADLRQQLARSEKAVEDFRKASGLIEGKGSAGKNATIESQQIGELNTQLVLASAGRAEAEARLQQVRSLTSSGSGVESVAEVLDSPLIQRLREQEAEVVRKTAELSTVFGERHPNMINVRAEIHDLRAKIDQEVERVVQGLVNSVEVARAREVSLNAGVEKLKDEVAAVNRAGIQLRELEREASANRALFETFLARSKETGEQGGIQRPDARVISLADVSDQPSFPRKGIIVAMAFIGSVFTGVFLVFLIERFDHGFRSMEQIEQLTGVAPLGLIPALKGLTMIGKTPEAYILEKPTSAYAEAIRTLHTSLLLSDMDKPPKVILFASALPKEGKTAVTLSLARLMANVGQKVVVVDCDLRRPEAHKPLGAPLKPGLSDFLAGNTLLEEIIHKDEKSTARVVPAGSVAPNPADLLGSDPMALFLAGLAKTYDLVIIDSSPVLAVSDVRVLSRHVDKVVFLVRWADTRREVAMSGLKQFLDAGADVAGVVLTMVDVKKHSRYGYGDSGYYYGRVSKYYTG